MIPLLLGLALVVAELTGTVRDPDGHPVPNATVVVIGITASPVSVRTDAEGRFRIDTLPEGRFDLTVSSPGLIGETRGVTVSSTEPTAPVNITMRVSAVAETLVVSAAQIDQPLSRVADATTIIDRQELAARQLATIGEALASVPGMTVARSGGPGTVTSLFPRGGESDFTLVLVDGIRVNTFGGGIDLAQVPLADVERIEVVRGPQSALYGSDAIGGVVQIITRRAGRPLWESRAEAGSRQTRRAAASTSGEHARWTWQAGGDYFADEGYTGLAPASGERVQNDDAEERQAWVGTGYRFSGGTDLAGVFRYVASDRGAPGPFGSDPASTFSGVDREARGETSRTSGGIRLVRPWGGATSRIRQRLEFDIADFDLQFTDRFGASDGETRRTHARVQTDAVLEAGFSLSGGVEWLGEQGSSTFITDRNGASAPVQRRVLGTFGEVRWNAHERVSLQGGLRVEHIVRDALAGDGFFRTSLPTDSITSLNPKVAGVWLVTPHLPGEGAQAWTRVRAAAGTGIRPPDMFEIAFTDNPSLKPERSRSFEAGVTQALVGGSITLDATTFVNQYDDLIISVGGLRDISRYLSDNISNAHARGLELAGAWRGSTRALLRASYTWLDAEIRAIDRAAHAPAPYQVGDRLLRRPTHQGAVDFMWTGSRVSAFASLGARGVTLDAEPTFGPTGGLFENSARTIVDVGASWNVVRGVAVQARVLNLFNEEYEEVLGYPAPGRTSFFGVRVAAGR